MDGGFTGVRNFGVSLLAKERRRRGREVKLYLLLGFLLLTLLSTGKALAESMEIGIAQRPGEFVPLSLTFRDENGTSLSLRQLVNKPTILALVYYRCTHICTPLLTGLADVLNQLPAEPGKDFSVLTVSFDENDTPEIARQKKKNYLKLLHKPFPEDAWKFLTGDAENIHSLAEAVGFLYKREGEDFEHPVSLIVLSPQGKIIRYLYGVDFLPMDVKLALVEANAGRAGPTISKVLKFCFSYDPKSHKLVFNTLRVSGTATLLLLLSFATFLAFTGKKREVQGGIKNAT